MSDRVSEERFTAGGKSEEGKSFYRRLIKRCRLNLEEDGGREEAQWGGGETRRGEMEGRRRRSEVKVTPALKNWSQLEGRNAH